MSITTSAGKGVSRHLLVVKQYFKKPMCLVIALLSLATLVTSFLYSTAATNFTKELLAAVNTTGQEVNVSNNVLSYALSGIVTLCLFMIFIMALTPNGNPGVWFSILHGLSVIELILTALGTLIIGVIEIIIIFSTKTIIDYCVNNSLGQFATMTPEQIDQLNRNVGSYRTSLIVIFVITLIICGLSLYYINSQTAFLKSVSLTCKNPQLKSKGAVPFGNLSMFFGVFMLVSAVIFFLTTGNTDNNMLSDMGIEMNTTFPDFKPIIMPYMIYMVCSALFMLLRGSFAKGWAQFAKENEDSVYETAGASSRLTDAAPMATYRSAPKASEARQQSQPYLIGEEEEEDKNKKSSYIPEELQQDYNNEAAMYGQPVGGQPYMNDPYGGGTPVGANPPYGSPDPFAQSPMGGNPYGNPYGGNPYGDPNGGQGGYNNGMM